MLRVFWFITILFFMAVSSPELFSVMSMNGNIFKTAMNNGKRVAPLWYTIIFFLVYFSINFIADIWPGVRGSLRGVADIGLLAILAVFSEILFMILACLGLILNNTDFGVVLGKQWIPRRDVPLGLLLGFIILLVNIFANHIFPAEKISSGSTLAPKNVLDVVFLVLLVLIGSFSEELIFRGYLQKELIYRMRNPALALAVQAILFGVSHGRMQSLADFCVEITMGLLLGFVFMRSDSLLPGIIAHISNNVFAFIYEFAKQ